MSFVCADSWSIYFMGLYFVFVKIVVLTVVYLLYFEHLFPTSLEKYHNPFGIGGGIREVRVDSAAPNFFGGKIIIFHPLTKRKNIKLTNYVIYVIVKILLFCIQNEYSN